MVNFFNKHKSAIHFCRSGSGLSGLSILICTLFILSFPKPSPAFEESQVKAVFLYNITKFVAWPENRKERKFFDIVLLGENPFNDQLREVVKGERVQGREINLLYYSDLTKINWKKIDLLFISDENPDVLKAVMKDSREKNVLTISDTRGFCSYGGMVNLLTVGSRIKIEVNREEVKKGGLTVSAQLLKLARIITTQDQVD